MLAGSASGYLADTGRPVDFHRVTAIQGNRQPRLGSVVNFLDGALRACVDVVAHGRLLG